MGLAISLVATEKEKVGQQGHPSVCIFFYYYYFQCIIYWRGDLTHLKKKKTLVLHKQVWYHVCANRGRGCYNTRLKEEGGCTIWYNEKEVRQKPSTNPVLVKKINK